MTPALEGSFTTVRRAHALLSIVTLALALSLAGCSRPLLERAIDARGGPLTSLTREVEADVKLGFPGTWRWRFEYREPDRLRWTLETYGDEQSYAFDGESVRFFLGSSRLGGDASTADFRSQVRWMSVTTLDALQGSDAVTVREVRATESPAADLPADGVAALDVVYRDDGARYTLYFDAADRLVAAAGPISIPTIGAGRMRATFADFREVDGFTLPYRGTYTLDEQPLFEERVLRYVPNDPRLEHDDFRAAQARDVR